ncbi:uncharacterized protein LOC134846731 [Symsagittifera roscoffensis]|uniref:uncharacterized protein LOC134846731 n=1 Tax=Symsagittifera roscoffensis TaxID=84072 RepID=UPI00307B729D
MSSKKKPGCLESLRDYFKKSPNKIPIAIVASLQAVIIVGATILIFELDKANTFQEKTGYATIDLDTLNVWVDSGVVGASSLNMRLGQGATGAAGGVSNCWQMRRGVDQVCLSWINYARLIMDYSSPSAGLHCYNFQWDFSAPDAHVRDCFKTPPPFISNLQTTPTQNLILSDIEFNESTPQSGYVLGGGGVTFSRSVNERVIMMTSEGAFLISTTIQHPITLVSEGDNLCIDFQGSRGRISHSPSSPSPTAYSEENLSHMQYSVCTSTNPHSTLTMTKEYFLKTITSQRGGGQGVGVSLGTNEMVSTATETIFWRWNPLQPNSLDTLEDMLNCTISNNSTLGNRLNVVLVEGLFPDQLDQLSPQVAERVGTAGEQRADVKFYLEVSPYFSVTNSHFITGTNNNYWLRDENGNAPALSVLQDSVKSVVDVTNEMAMQWYEQLLLNATAFLSADGVVVNGDSISKLPVHFTTKQPLSYPYQMIENFIDYLAKFSREKYKEKLDSVLVRIPNFKQLKEFSLILRGENLSTTDVNPLDAAIFQNAPMVSVDIERVFSSMEQIQSPQRMRLAIENLKQHLIASWYCPGENIKYKWWYTDEVGDIKKKDRDFPFWDIDAYDMDAGLYKVCVKAIIDNEQQSSLELEELAEEHRKKLAEIELKGLELEDELSEISENAEESGLTRISPQLTIDEKDRTHHWVDSVDHNQSDAVVVPNQEQHRVLGGGVIGAEAPSRGFDSHRLKSSSLSTDLKYPSLADRP